jgi:pyruvate dehydrogenase E2 component (dihydrolipoamide acetyltransferase)
LSAICDEINACAARNDEGAPAYQLSIDDFMIKALALALQQVPAANAIGSSDGIVSFRHSDIAVVVPGGPLTPVVIAAETKTLSTISNELSALAARARKGTLRPLECHGGATTIFRLGSSGIRELSATIRSPQSTILAIGGARRDAVEAADGRVTFAGRISATLSCDARVFDEAVGAELLTSFGVFMENPLRMLA